MLLLGVLFHQQRVDKLLILLASLFGNTAILIHTDMVILFLVCLSSLWYFFLLSNQIDGGHCSPQAHGKTVANLGYANEVNNEYRSSEGSLLCIA